MKLLYILFLFHLTTTLFPNEGIKKDCFYPISNFTSDSLGDYVDSFDFGAELFVSNDSDIEVFLEKIKNKHQGKTVILDLWGSFCKPCLEDFASSTEIKKELKKNNIVMVYLCAGISSKPDKWKEMIEKYQLVGDHVYMDRTITRAYMAKFGFKRYPGYLVLDETGNYKKNLVRSVSSIKLDRFLQQI